MAERAIPVNVYQCMNELLHTRGLWRKNCKLLFRLLKSSKNPQLHSQQVLPVREREREGERDGERGRVRWTEMERRERGRECERVRESERERGREMERDGEREGERGGKERE